MKFTYLALLSVVTGIKLIKKPVFNLAQLKSKLGQSDPSPADMFATGDADSDGNLTLDEFMTYAVETQAPAGYTVESLNKEERKGLEDAFGDLDGDGDGTVTLEEFNKKI